VTAQGRYFLVRDVSCDDDKLSTLRQFSAPNVRESSHGGVPVYGLGQPTMNAVNDFIRALKDRGKQVSRAQHVANTLAATSTD